MRELCESPLSVGVSPWAPVGSCRVRLIECWRRSRKASTSSIAYGTRYCRAGIGEICTILSFPLWFWWSSGAFGRFTTRRTQTRRRNSRPISRRRLRSCSGIAIKSRHGYSLAISRIRRLGFRPSCGHLWSGVHCDLLLMSFLWCS